MFGGALRGGREIVDGAGRLRNRNPNDTRKPPAGKVETALEANAVPTQADIESPLDTGDIAAGRAGIAVAQAENEVSREFEALGLPEVAPEAEESVPFGKLLNYRNFHLRSILLRRPRQVAAREAKEVVTVTRFGRRLGRHR